MSLRSQLSRALISVLLFVSPFVVYASPQHRVGFESSEHIAAGDKVKLFFGSNDPGSVGHLLHLPNGLQLTYSQMLAVSGDFYAVVGQAISEGKTPLQRQAYFMEAFNTLAKDPAAVSELPKIYEIIKYEQDAINEGIKNGEKPEIVYKRISESDNRQWNCITGGGCGDLWWMNQGRYLLIAKQGYDHFGNDAWLAYQAGHSLAITAAIAAHQSGDINQLEYAYALDAFASHFLSDRFSSGHIRTPFVSLVKSVTPSVVGSVLVTFMHNEENQEGLHVHNLRGDHWVAFGDRQYYNLQNQENSSIMNEALQESVNQIFYAYKEGRVSSDDKVASLIPHSDEIGNDLQDITPLFHFEDSTNTLYRRSDVANLYDNHLTADWWGWTTLIMLSQQRGLPTESQHELALSGHGEEAMRYGLIQDKETLRYLKESKAHI